MREDLLIVFCRSPRPGEVKRRLTPPLNEAQSCAAYVAMVLDTEMVAVSLRNVDVWFSCPGEPSQTLRGMLREGTPFVEQSGLDLGDRMNSAFRAGFDAGYKRVAIINADCPDLPTSYIETAFERLTEDPEVAVFGPTLDGGYYLAGLSQPRPSLFQGIPWSHPDTLNTTLRIAECDNIPVCVLPRWQDVDTWLDLQDCLQRGGALHLGAIETFGLLDPLPDL